MSIAELSQRQTRSHPQILLVAMPFVSAHRPSIQIGSLAAIARQHGHTAQTLHASLDLAGEIGLADYERLCAQRLRALGDWLYSVEAFDEDAPDREGQFLNAFEDDLPEGMDKIRLRHIRAEIIPRHLDRMCAEVRSTGCQLVGFTSTFQQNVASLALARRLKQQTSDLITLFGGANYEGDMGKEFVRSMRHIDYAITGEADASLPAFLQAIRDERDPLEVPGVLCRRNQTAVGVDSEPFLGMNELPTPDYSEYFERVEKLGITNATSRRSVYLPFESSRGCWWGAKSHCTFCGLNGQTMAYRSKTPERVLAEINDMNHRYRGFHFEAVDNILDMKYLKEVFPEVESKKFAYNFFFEVKSNLNRRQVLDLARGGVHRIQPGIESLNSDVLKKMKKGVSAAINVNLLRWAKYYGIEVGWNVLWGFPGEEARHYQEQEQLFATLHHLQPPNGGGRVWMERFSPMFFDRENYPTKWIRPEASYGYVYPSYVDLEQAAYFFEYEFEHGLPDSTYIGTKQSIEDWQAAWKKQEKPSLTLWKGSDIIQVEDRRDPGEPKTHTFDGPLASIYQVTMSHALPVERVAEKLGMQGSLHDIEEVLDEFVERRLMMKDGKSYLALALPSKGGAINARPT